MEKYKVTFYPDNKSAEVAKDATILSAAISCGVYINSACGGDGVCGRCKVLLKKGKVLFQPTGHILAHEKKQGICLACATAVQSDLEVEVPAESRLNLEGLTQEQINARIKKDYTTAEEIDFIKPQDQDIFTYAPLTQKIYLELPLPTLDDKVSDFERLQREIFKLKNLSVGYTSLANIKSLGELLRSCDWKVTVTLSKRNGLPEILLVEPQDTSAKNFGACFDIGTTTVTAQLVDLNSKNILGTKATYNKQAVFGSDVITRIIYAKDSDGLQDLYLAVVEDMNEMIHELCQENKIDLNDVRCAVCAGNTTMIHLLLRIDPTYIRRAPYVPTLNFVPVMRAAEAQLRINPRGLLFCLPGVASYVGGDATAGVLSCGLYKEEELGILIDIGTNGEVVLGNKDFLISAAASAGPAFEGSGVSCGMRASKGAIQKVNISPSDFSVSYEVIAGSSPQGICGSGYIDIIAEMLRVGLLHKDGKIKDIKHPRIRLAEAGKEFILVFKENSGSGKDIFIAETDIDNLKRAKAAIYSAVSILVKHMGFDFKQVKKIFIAGGFGTYLDMNNAIYIGLLPDLDKSHFVFVGNSSLSGARQVILSYDAKNKADEIARKMAYFELSVEPGYMDEYMAALFFPHTDLAKFPSVRL